MRGSALFFLDALVVDPKSGKLVTSPSISPENSHGHGSSLVAGPTMDQAIIRDLFTACHQVGRDPRDRRRLRRPADGRAREAGALQDRQGRPTAGVAGGLGRRRRRHPSPPRLSPVRRVFPSDQIAIDTTPKLADAAKVSLNTRGDISTGWAIAWRLNLWSRLGDGDRAHKILSLLLGPERTYPNMFDAHPPFQIDGNFGGTSGMTEMVLQSRNDQILLLPALPSAWPTGHLTGLRARGAVGIDLIWTRGKLETAVFTAAADGRHHVRYGASAIDLDLKKGQRVRLTARDGVLRRA